MRDNYAGDIGDFANNGLLRVLCGKPEKPVPGMRLGIIWYRHLDVDDHGNVKGYLDPSASNNQTFRACDKNLYDELQTLVCQSKARNKRLLVTDVINLPIFPPGTQHYPKPVPDPPNAEERQKWFNRALDHIADSDVIFLNPDTGMHWNAGSEPQYVYPCELQKLLKMDKILVIYQHQQRTDWVADNTRSLKDAPLNVKHLRVCRWNRGSVRGYFIVAQNKNQIERIDKRLDVLRDSRWVTEGHMSLV